MHRLVGIAMLLLVRIGSPLTRFRAWAGWAPQETGTRMRVFFSDLKPRGAKPLIC
jgi:hypothetical protein